MRLPEPVRLLVEECVVASQAVVVDLVFRGHYRKPVLEVYVDGPGPVTTELCAEVSRRISAALEGKDLISADYRLEVSSPGLDRPLKYLWQYWKHLGRPFRFKLASPEGGEALEGTLSAVEDEVLVVKTADAAETRVRFADVREARIVLPW
ncbi:MAG: ribosome maturation factor RimP [Bacteroidetes bacterium]|nr:ribosome maturation factor RimP [Bacteroidota bacterium]